MHTDNRQAGCQARDISRFGTMGDAETKVVTGRDLAKLANGLEFQATNIRRTVAHESHFGAVALLCHLRICVASQKDRGDLIVGSVKKRSILAGAIEKRSVIPMTDLKYVSLRACNTHLLTTRISSMIKNCRSDP